MGLWLGPNVHLHAQKEDAQRVTISDRRAHESTRKRIMIRRHYQIELLEAAEGMEGILYGPEIDDLMWVKKKSFTIYKMLLKLWTRFFQNYDFKVGVHDFSDIAELIGLKILRKLYKYIF